MAPFTTHKVAGLLGVSLPTVVNWINEGKLEAYKTPGGHRRIPVEALKAFCLNFSLPLPESLSDGDAGEALKSKPVILVSSYERDFAELIQDFMRIKTPVPVEIVETALHAGLVLGERSKGVLLIDQLNSNVDPLEALELLQSRFQLVVLADNDKEANRLRENGIPGVLSRPLELEALLKALMVALKASGAVA
jgi:excisionase family DNA binding protein